jgi:hypothetical protein
MAKRGSLIVLLDLCVFIVMVMFLFLPVGKSIAAEFNVIPSLSLSEEYNDNIFLDSSSSKKEEAFITRVIPGIETLYKTERTDLRLSGRLQQSWYSRLSYLDELDQYYAGSINYILTPSLSFGGRAGYTVDSQPDRDILETGLRVTDDKRQRVNYGVSGAYTINEKMNASFSYDYSKDTYLGSDPLTNDTESNNANLGFTRNLGDYGPGPLIGRMNFGYSHYLYSDSTVDSYRATVGLSSTLSEKWSFLIDVGARRSDTDFTDIGNRENTEQNWGWVVMSSISYKARYGTATLSVNHDVAPAGGTTGVTERTGAALNLTHQFTYELSGTFATSYIRNKADRGEFGTLGVDTDTYWVSPGIHYAFNKDITLSASYNYLYQKDKIAHTTADRNLFLITLRMQHSLFN